MAAEIKLNTAALEGLHSAIADAALATMGLVRDAVVDAQVMPFDVGTLQNNLTAVTQMQDGEEVTTSLVTDGPYARNLYNHPEYNFQTGNNPNAGAEWLSPWLPGGDQAEFISATYAEELRKRVSK